MTSDEEVNESDSQGSDVQDQFNKGFNAMGRSGVSDMQKNLDDQESSVDKAQANQQELDDAKEGLDEAREHYDDLEKMELLNQSLHKPKKILIKPKIDTTKHLRIHNLVLVIWLVVAYLLKVLQKVKINSR